MADRKLAGRSGRPPANHIGEWREPFIKAIRDMGIVSRACEAVGISRATVYRTRQAEPAFATLWDDAFEDAIDTVEGVVRDRALNGVVKTKIIQEPNEAGELVVTRREAITEYSDTLLLAILNGRRSQVFSRHARIAVETGEAKVYIEFPMSEV